jgi:UDP-N-acetylmuramate: L-alanyl-gamma-D-glutamyl-meso-diaminopimelate ligase
VNNEVLDPSLNQAPDAVRHVHLMGICGTGMAALAGLLQQSGYTVSGSDANVYPPMSDFLAGEGIHVMQGYAPENLDPAPDLVVVGNVIRAVNPEARALGERRIPYLSMPQALGYFFLKDNTSLVVAGTHGKTTTSSLLATTMHYAGCTPGFFIGGLVEAFGRNSQRSDSGYFVVEGDEYDTAFFNKVSKFLHYRSQCAILTSIEFDHADIFDDLEAIKDSFSRFIDLIPKDGCLVACFDDPLVQELSRRASCPVLSYGSSDNCRYRIAKVRAKGLTTAFTLLKDGKHFGEYLLPMPGMHNVQNGAAVIALLDHLGFDPQQVGQALQRFQGVKRRQQVRGVVNGVTVIDDFAHHPTAVKATVAALRKAYPDQRLLIVFEPRTNTSRRAVFQDVYVQAFTGADRIFIREHVPLADVPALEQFSSGRLAADLQAMGQQADFFVDTGAILDSLKEEVGAGDVVAILSNGGFDGIHSKLLELLAES